MLHFSLNSERQWKKIEDLSKPDVCKWGLMQKSMFSPLVPVRLYQRSTFRAPLLPWLYPPLWAVHIMNDSDGIRRISTPGLMPALSQAVLVSVFWEVFITSSSRGITLNCPQLCFHVPLLRGLSNKADGALLFSNCILLYFLYSYNFVPLCWKVASFCMQIIVVSN